MSKDRTRPGRAVLAVGSAGLIAGTLIALPGSSYADPNPSISEVQDRVDRLNEDASVINERVNDLRLRVAETGERLDVIETDMDRQRRKVEALRDQIGQYAAADYRAGGMDTTVQLLVADDPDEFLAQMNAAQTLAGQQGDRLTELLAEQKELAEQTERAKAALERQRAARHEAAEQQEIAQAKVDKAEALLERLTAEQQARLAAQEAARERAQLRSSRDFDRDSDSDSSTETVFDAPPPSSGRGAIALAYAEAQLGDPYVFGASGPDSFDCSGLTLAAWAQAGVSLPHSSRAQYDSGTKISRSELQPGDLVIFYSSMHHVGIYAGDNQVIHAPRPGSSVEYIDMDHMPYAGAVRPG